MKTTLRLPLLLSFFLLIGLQSFSQVHYGRTYRVVAYKKGDLSVKSISNEVIVIPTMTLYVPNTFTPNGDGINDTFGATGEAVKEFNLVVFDRWGQKIFETSDSNKRWDGTFNGEKVLTGSYIYRIVATGPLGGKETKEGQINLIM